MPRRNKRGKRTKKGGKSSKSAPVSTVVTTVSTVAGNVLSIKNFTLTQMIPDVSVGRQVMLHSVTCQLANAATPASSPGGMVLVNLVGEPWVTANAVNGIFASQQWKVLNSTQRTTCAVTANQSGQRVPVEIDRSGTMFQLRVQSALAGTWQVVMLTRYTLLVDTVVTVYP